MHIYLLLVLSFASNATTALSTKPEQYPEFIVKVAQKYNIPTLYFYALAAKESSAKLENGKRRPWPYTMNYKGKPYYFANYEELLAASKRLLSHGITNFDVGFYQINYKWNKDKFESIEQLAHPAYNIEIAARIFREKYDQYSDWYQAAGRYHNPRNNKGRAVSYANEYRKYVELVANGKY